MTDDGATLDELAVSLFRLMRLWERETSRHVDGLPSVGRRHVVRAFALDDGGVGVCSVAERLHVTMSTASRLLERARRDGLVVDVSGGTDGRFTPHDLTGAGRDLLDVVVAADRAALSRATKGWSQKVTREVTADVELLRSRLDAAAARLG